MGIDDKAIFNFIEQEKIGADRDRGIRCSMPGLQ